MGGLMALEEYRVFIKDTKLEIYDELLNYVIDLGNGGGLSTDVMIMLMKIEKHIYGLKNKLLQ